MSKTLRQGSITMTETFDIAGHWHDFFAASTARSALRRRL